MKIAQKIYFFFFALTFFALNLPYAYTGLGVDASWSQALTMTIEHGKVFGKDFVFTYGPLGYFNTGLIPKNSSVWVSVLFQVFVLFNLLVIINYAFLKAGKNWWKTAILIYFLFVPWGFFADTTFTLFYFFLFHLLYALHHRSFISLFIVSIIALLIFYIKVSLSLIVLTVFISTFIYFQIKKIFSWQKLVFVSIFLASLVFSFSKILHVDIAAYLGASIEIIDAYQDAMADIQTTKIDLLMLLPFIGSILLLAGLSFLLNLKTIFKKHQSLFLYILLGLTLFLSVKQQFSTILSLNSFGFFLFMPVLFGLLYLFGDVDLKLKPSMLVMMVFIASLGGTQYIRFYYGNHTLNGFIMTYLSPNFFQISSKIPKIDDLTDYFRKRNPINYFEAVANYKYEGNFSEEFYKDRKLPDDVLKRIGNNTIDIFPSEISYIYFNKLNYENRPIVQSYAAYSTSLVHKNGEKYRSATAPNFVLYQQQGFRNRYALWEDSEVILELLQRYKIIDTLTVKADSLLLFERMQTPNIFKNEVVKAIEGKFGENINIQVTQDKFQYLQLNIEYSLIGKLMRLALQPPYLYCTITYQDGKQEQYRATPPILKSGFIANKQVKTLEDAALFFNTKGNKNKNIVALKFDSPLSFGFKTNFSGQCKTIWDK